MGNQVADAEAAFRVVNITPDFCRVNGNVVPFEIEQVLPPELASYSANVTGRGEKVLKVGSIVSGVTGNAGAGVTSTVSLSGSHTITVEGNDEVLVNKSPICRNADLCLMNVKVE